MSNFHQLKVVERDRISVNFTGLFMLSDVVYMFTYICYAEEIKYIKTLHFNLNPESHLSKNT